MSSTPLTLSLDDLRGNQVALGIVTVVFTVIAISLVRYTRRIRRMPAFFKSHFSLFKNSRILSLVATALYYVLLVLPVILLIIWIAILGSAKGADPALPILFTFLFVAVLALPVSSWLFYPKILVVFLLFITAQILTMALSWNDGRAIGNKYFIDYLANSSTESDFFTLSAILLSVNGALVSSALWLFDGSCWSLTDYTSPANKQLIRQTIQIWKPQSDANGGPPPPNIISGGVYYYISTRPTLRYIMIAVFYLLGLIVLMTYSLVGYYHSVYGTIALINSLCVITTDVVLVIIIFYITSGASSEIASGSDNLINPTSNSIAIMAVRACLVGFTAQRWFLGECLLFLLLGAYLFVLLIDKHYPRLERISSGLQVQKTNLLAIPQTAIFILLLMFAGSIYYVSDDTGVASETLPITRFSMNGTWYQFHVIGVATIILQLALFFYMLSLRLVQRSRNKVRSINFYYLGCDSCSEYYFFILLAYGLLVVLGFYMYKQTDSAIIWSSCVFLPLFYQAFVLFYANWQENDFLLLGDVEIYNKKVLKRKERIDKVKALKLSAMNKFKVKAFDGGAAEKGNSTGAKIIPSRMINQQQLESQSPKGNNSNEKPKNQSLQAQISNMNLLEQAGQVQSNFMVDDYKGATYQDWRGSYNILTAFRQDKLLPTDRKIMITLLVMLLSLLGYSLVYTIAQKGDMTAVIVSVEILFLFLTFIPLKRYFCTLERPNIGQIVFFALGLLLNYFFGIVSYVDNWNRSQVWTIWWAVINVFLLALYAALALLRDKGLHLATYIMCVVSVLLLLLAGVLIIALFGSVGGGLAVIGVSVYYAYVVGLYIIYLNNNRSLPQFMHYITIAIVICTSFAVMIYGFASQDFDDFFGFSITYLVINFLIIVYGGYALALDIVNRFDQPNFYSPYGTPIFKYDPAVKSVQENIRPLSFWLGGWLMFYGYTLLMEVFLIDTNTGTSAASLFFAVVYLTFVYFTTYNVYKAGKMKKAITQQVIEDSWKEIIEIRRQNGKTDIDINTLERQLERQVAREQSSDQSQMLIHELQEKVQKARQDEEIALVNLWTRIVLKCDSVKVSLLIYCFIEKENDEVCQFCQGGWEQAGGSWNRHMHRQ